MTFFGERSRENREKREKKMARNSKKKKSSAPQEETKEEILYQQLADFKFIATLHTLMDVIPAIATLNLVFQQSLLDMSAVRPAVCGALAAIDRCGSWKGLHKQQFQEQMKKNKKGEASFKGFPLLSVTKLPSTSTHLLIIPLLWNSNDCTRFVSALN